MIETHTAVRWFIVAFTVAFAIAAYLATPAEPKPMHSAEIWGDV